MFDLEQAIKEDKLWKLRFSYWFNLYDIYDLNLIDLACKYGRKQIIEYLINNSRCSKERIYDLGWRKGLFNIIEYFNNDFTPNLFRFFDAISRRYIKFADYFVSNYKDQIVFLQNYNFYNYIYRRMPIDLEISRYLHEKGLLTPNFINELLIKAAFQHNLEELKYFISLGADVTVKNSLVIHEVQHSCESGYYLFSKTWVPTNIFPVLKYLLSKGADFNKLRDPCKSYFMSCKYFRKWRIIVLKKFICKVISPLYYSPGFAGEKLEQKKLKDLRYKKN